MYKHFVFAILIVLFAVGCGAKKGMLFQPEKLSDDNKAIIYFYRTAGYGEAAIFNSKISVFVENIGEIALPLEQYEVRIVEPGTYKIKVSSDMANALYVKDKDIRTPIYREKTLKAGDELFVNLYTVDSRRERKTKLKIVKRELALKQLSTMHKVSNK